MRPIVLAITGASGAPYALRLLEVLLSQDLEIHAVMSPAAAEVFRTEVGLHLDPHGPTIEQLVHARRAEDRKGLLERAAKQLHLHRYQNFSAGIASGSFRTQGMVICPCSMGTLAAVAGGLSTNLIQRAADVHLKECRRLIVVPRETPLSAIHLQNMLTLQQAGGIVLPAAPGFYHQPRSIEDLVDFVVMRICDHLDVPVKLISRWGDPESSGGGQGSSPPGE